MTILTIPFAIYKDYIKASMENHNGKIPKSETFLLFLSPLIVGICIVSVFGTSVEKDLAANLLVVHGIFVSVLVASYAAFLDLIERPEALNTKFDDSKVLDNDYQYLRAKKVVKKLLFASNSLSIFLSFVIIILICFAQKITELPSSDLLTFQGIMLLTTTMIKTSFSTLLYYLITLNFLVVLRTVHIMSKLVFSDSDSVEKSE